jgi:hypothetical protein
MGRKKGSDRSKSKKHLDKLKWETAEQLGLDDDLKDPDELSVREAGKIGGNMVRKLIRKGEKAIADESGGTSSGNTGDRRSGRKR